MRHQGRFVQGPAYTEGTKGRPGWPVPIVATGSRMPGTWPPTHHARVMRPQFPQGTTLVLGLLVVATLLMPVSYRAGTDQSHPHTIFQGLIDLIAGQPHQHHDGEPHHHHDADTPHAGQSPLATPPGILEAAGHQDDLGPPGEPDIPSLLGMSMPISDHATVQALALLLAALLAGDAPRAPWSATRTLAGRAPAVESPPPR